MSEREKLREPDEWSLEGTQAYVRMRVCEGLDRGRPFDEILEVVLEEGLGIYELSDALEVYAKEEEKLHSDYVFSKYRACGKCHVVKDVEKEMICLNCAAGKSKFENLKR